MFEYEFDYHPIFIKECGKVIKNCPSFEEDFKRLKNTIRADLDIYNHKLPKKYLQVPNLNISLPIFKFKGFYCKKGNGSDFRIIFAVDRANNLIIFLELYKKSRKNDLDRKRIYDLI
ncbi:MAG: hypothetical protein LBD03_07625 [Methanobrevibacter sp.]|jgi:mRNA-degrading endonuclease RelE of RelBE toxin-antitoxin system|nr:hypothetical protein [Candidatus Methanovirga procula]